MVFVVEIDELGNLWILAEVPVESESDLIRVVSVVGEAKAIPDEQLPV